MGFSCPDWCPDVQVASASDAVGENPLSSALQNPALK